MALMHNLSAKLNTSFFFGVTVIGILAAVNWGTSFFIEQYYEVKIQKIDLLRLSTNYMLDAD